MSRAQFPSCLVTFFFYADFHDHISAALNPVKAGKILRVGRQRERERNQARLYTVLYSSIFSRWGGGKGKLIKGSGDGEGNLWGRKEKKRKFGENETFDSTKS